MTNMDDTVPEADPKIETRSRSLLNSQTRDQRISAEVQ